MSSRRYLLTGVLLLAVWGWCGMTWAAWIELKPTAVIDRPIVRLGDVAIINSNDPVQRQGLALLELFPSPAPGTRQLVTWDSIQQRLRALGVDLENVDFKGRSQVVISSEKLVSGNPSQQQTIQQAHLESQSLGLKGAPYRIPAGRKAQAEAAMLGALERYLARFQPDAARTTWKVTIPLEQLSRLPEIAADEFEVAPVTLDLHGPGLIPIRYLNTQGQLAIMTVRCEPMVPQVGTVVVAARDLPRNHVLTTEDLTSMITPNAVENGLELTGAIGQRLKQPLRTGEPLEPKMLDQIPLIRSGDIVSLTVRLRGISVQTPTKAQGGGGLGDKVTLVSLDRREMFEARITGFQQAEMSTRVQPTAVTPPQFDRLPSTPPGNRFHPLSPGNSTALPVSAQRIQTWQSPLYPGMIERSKQ